CISVSRYLDPRDPHSSPTRRSSDLSSTYVASGRVRYQDSGMRLVAERLEGDQDADTHRVDNVAYQLTERRGNGGAERIEMKGAQDRKSTRLNSSHVKISYAVFCLKK